MPKIFGIGMFKTGTTSLREAFQILGYETNGAYWRIFPELQPLFDLTAKGFLPHHAAIKTRASLSQAFCDSPWLFLYRSLDEWFPGSRFILTVRDSKEVAESDYKMWHRTVLHAVWQSETGTDISRGQLEERYLRHIDNVRHYFSGRDDLLELDVTRHPDPWEPLSEFLGVEKPSVDFPHENKAPDG